MSNSLDFDKIPISDYSVAHTPIRKKNNKSKYISTLLVVVIVIFGLAYSFAPKKKNALKSVVSQTKSQVVNSSSNKTSTKIYSSAFYNLTVNIPDGWNVINDNKLSLTIASPTQNLVDTSNKNITGRIVLSVAPTGQPPAGLKGKDALEVIESEKITYTEPTASQLAQSYISLVQYQSTISSNGLDAIFVTGNSGYGIGQTVPFSKLNNLNPTIVIYFQNCSDSKCSNPINTTINDSMWSNSNFKTTIENVLKSFSLS